MQKKQKIQFAVLIVLLAALAAAYFGIRSYNKKQEEKREQEAEAAQITLTSFKPEDIIGLSYDYDGTVYEFEKNADQWQSVNDSGLVLDQEAFASFAESAGMIKAAAKVDADADTDYGFDQPLRTVTSTTDSGTASLIFGMKNEMLDQYYVKTSEDSTIYLVEESVYTIFDKTAEDFKAEETKTDTDTETQTDTE